MDEQVEKLIADVGSETFETVARAVLTIPQQNS